MGAIIWVIIFIVVVYLLIKLVILAGKLIISALPYFFGLIGVGLIGYGIYYIFAKTSLIRLLGNILRGSLLGFILKAIFFVIIFILIWLVSLAAYEIFRIIRLRWLLIPLCLVGIFVAQDSSLVPNAVFFAISLLLVIGLYLWALFQYSKINKYLEFNADCDEENRMFYSSFCSALVSIYLYLENFPNKWLDWHINPLIYLTLFTYAFMFFSVTFLYTCINIVKKTKEYIDTNVCFSQNDLVENPLKGQDNGLNYAKRLILKMKKNKLIVELPMKEQKFVLYDICRLVAIETYRNEGIMAIQQSIKRAYHVELGTEIIESMISLLPKQEEPVASGIEKTMALPKVGPEIMPGEAASEAVQVAASKEIPEALRSIDDKKASFQLLRYPIRSLPIINAKMKFKEAYFGMLLENLPVVVEDSALGILVKDYAHELGIAFKLGKATIGTDQAANHKIIVKKEFCKLGFLKYRIRKYKYLLLCEIAYFRGVMTGKVDKEWFDRFSSITKLKTKEKDVMLQYICTAVSGQVMKAEEILLKTNNRYISETIWPFQKGIAYSHMYGSLAKYNVAVCATMSSGKSTFVNALLGKDYIPSKNEACTTKVTSVADDDSLSSVVGMFVKADGNYGCATHITLDQLGDWNNRSDIVRIQLEANLDGIRSRDGIIIVSDTPGTNYSQDESHNKATMDFLKHNKIDMLLYIINAEHASTTDNQILIRQIKNEVLDKQSTKILFLVNKIDSFDVERADDIVSVLDHIKAELIEWGFSDPWLIPISANAARLFKKVLKDDYLSKREQKQFKNLFDLFYTEKLDLLQFVDQRLQLIEHIDNTVGQIEIDDFSVIKPKVEIALLRTGLPLVEKILDKEINDKED